MIQNDRELSVTQERITFFLDLLGRLAVSSQAEEFPLVTGGYRAELERMQQDVVDYLAQQAKLERAAWAKLGRKAAERWTEENPY